jgi:hypothetical protein
LGLSWVLRIHSSFIKEILFKDFGVGRRGCGKEAKEPDSSYIDKVFEG